MIRLIGQDKNDNKIVTMGREDWDSLQNAAGIPYDKRRDTIEMSSTAIIDTIYTLREMKSFRKELGAMLKKWDKLATAIDAVLEEGKK